jgi:hypothetical protein
MAYLNLKKTLTKPYSKEWKEVEKIEEVGQNQDKETNSTGDLVKEAKTSQVTKTLLMLLLASTKTTLRLHFKETNLIQVYIQTMGDMDNQIHSNSLLSLFSKYLTCTIKGVENNKWSIKNLSNRKLWMTCFLEKTILIWPTITAQCKIVEVESLLEGLRRLLIRSDIS